MADPTQHRQVTVERTSLGQYVARNGRGGEIRFGTGDVPEFTPVELLLVAIGGCSLVDVDFVTSRRADPQQLQVTAEAEKVKDDQGNILKDIRLAFQCRFPDGAAGDRARAVLPDIVARSHDRLCTVSRTVEAGTPIAVRIQGDEPATA